MVQSAYSIQLTWSPPSEPNGILHHYEVWRRRKMLCSDKWVHFATPLPLPLPLPPPSSLIPPPSSCCVWSMIALGAIYDRIKCDLWHSCVHSMTEYCVIYDIVVCDLWQNCVWLMIELFALYNTVLCDLWQNFVLSIIELCVICDSCVCSMTELCDLWQIGVLSMTELCVMYDRVVSDLCHSCVWSMIELCVIYDRVMCDLWWSCLLFVTELRAGHKTCLTNACTWSVASWRASVETAATQDQRYAQQNEPWSTMNYYGWPCFVKWHTMVTDHHHGHWPWPTMVTEHGRPWSLTMVPFNETW